MDLHLSTIHTSIDPNVLSFKQVFICLPIDGLSNREVEAHVNQIEKKLSSIYPGYQVITRLDAENLWTPEDLIIFEPKGKESLEHLGECLQAISGTDLVVFCAGWSGSVLCSEIHRVLEDYGKTVDYMYEWELDSVELLN